MNKLLLAITLLTMSAAAQDTVSYQWPVTPFNTSQSITGTFCEFRNTLTSNHFHNGADVPKADGSPVYSVIDGTVTAISPSSESGTSAYVRVAGTVNGIAKNMAYVHIEPSPSLVIGQSVTKGVTVLGNILSGQGHTHLVDGAFDSEMNALRKTGGLEPYIDTWAPKVISVEFHQDNSTTKFTNGKVSGLFDIVAQLVEVNANAAPNSGSTSNNGVYQTGYKILSADKSTVVYTPAVNGVRYKFDRKPNDDHSNVAYTLTSTTSLHIYYLTNGAGNIGTSVKQSIVNGSLNAAALPAGPYQAMVYAMDTHGNADTVYVPFEVSAQDVVAPAAPVLRSVLNDSTKRITLRWKANTEPDLKGYRLYSSVNGTTWSLMRNEDSLKRTMTSYAFNGITSTTPVYFRLTAVDSAAVTNESGPSDSYGVRPNIAGNTILVVDGFDRTGGSYKLSSHPFAMTAGLSIPHRYETAHNSTVTDGSVKLTDYHTVIWLFGDESSTDETFGAAEQSAAGAYLKAGGRLFVSGSEVAYDLDRASGPSVSDRDFFNNYLKADYAGDASGSYTVNGTGLLNGISFSYGDTLQGSPYREDYPDYVTAFGGSTLAASYANGLGAMTVYNGMFTGGTSAGSVVLLCVPFETIHSKSSRDAVMTRVLGYFGYPVSVAERMDAVIPAAFSLEQNFPNPFNPVTTIRFSLPQDGPATLAIYDILGKEVAVPVRGELQAGTYSVQWNGSGAASGLYFYRLTAGGTSITKKLMLTK
ncbi:MAG: T9SS type A sorting domain-containing protein [Bacteroidetes bacterium]|nr:T9SS type A sorting domain-containing protein [Bacteroidota bacterium]